MRLILYLLVWLYAQTAIVFATVGFAALVLFYTSVAPVACIWTGARLGLWSGLGVPGAYVLMLMGVGLFGSIRLQLLDLVLAGQERIRRHAESMDRLRDDVWRQYRDRDVGRPTNHPIL